MRSWQIHIPHRTRSDSLIQVAANARQLEDADDRAVTRRLALDAAEDGLTSAGELLDRIERADPGERRAMLDKARAAADLPTVEDVEARARFEAANEMARRRVVSHDDPPPEARPHLVNGAIVMHDPAELERERRKDEQLREEREQRRKEREAEAEAIRAARERYERETADDCYINPPVVGVPAKQVRW